MNAKLAKRNRKIAKLRTDGIIPESYYLHHHPANPEHPDKSTAEIRVSSYTTKGVYKSLKRSIRRRSS